MSRKSFDAERESSRLCVSLEAMSRAIKERVVTGLVGIFVLSTLSGCAFMPPNVERVGGEGLSDADVTTIQLAGHPGKQEGALIFEKIDGMQINEIESLTQKGYFLNDAFHFHVPVVIQLPPGKHEFLVRYEYIGLKSLTRFEETIETTPCSQHVSIDGTPGTLYVVDWKRDGNCVDLVMSQEPFGKVHAR